MNENLVEKYTTKTYIDKDYKDIVVSEKSFVNIVQENKKQKEVIDKIKECIKDNGDMLIDDYDTLEEINKILEEIE